MELLKMSSWSLMKVPTHDLVKNEVDACPAWYILTEGGSSMGPLMYDSLRTDFPQIPLIVANKYETIDHKT